MWTPWNMLRDHRSWKWDPCSSLLEIRGWWRISTSRGSGMRKIRMRCVNALSLHSWIRDPSRSWNLRVPERASSQKLASFKSLSKIDLSTCRSYIKWRNIRGRMKNAPSSQRLTRRHRWSWPQERTMCLRYLIRAGVEVATQEVALDDLMKETTVSSRRQTR